MNKTQDNPRYRYKVTVFLTSPLIANVAMIKYIRETLNAEQPLFRQSQAHGRSICFVYFYTIQAALAYIKLLKYAGREYEGALSDGYDLIEKEDSGKLTVLERGQCR